MLKGGAKVAVAMREIGLKRQTAYDWAHQYGDLCLEFQELGLSPPTMAQHVDRKPGSGAKSKINNDEVKQVFDACCKDKKSRKKRWVDISREEGFEVCRRTIEIRLRKMGLKRMKSTKKLELTDIQRAQQYEIALSRKDWTLADWKCIIWSDEASILVGEHRGKQLLSCTNDEQFHKDCIERRYNNYSEAMF
jgi:hypothetical protein